MNDRKILQRILKKVQLSTSGCWVFNGWHDGHGYSKVWVDGKGEYVHRTMYQWFFRRKLRRDVQLDHGCLNRGCCNPLHLKPMKNKKNSQLRTKRAQMKGAFAT